MGGIDYWITVLVLCSLTAELNSVISYEDVCQNMDTDEYTMRHVSIHNTDCESDCVWNDNDTQRAVSRYAPWCHGAGNKIMHCSRYHCSESWEDLYEKHSNEIGFHWLTFGPLMYLRYFRLNPRGNKDEFVVPQYVRCYAIRVDNTTDTYGTSVITKMMLEVYEANSNIRDRLKFIGAAGCINDSAHFEFYGVINFEADIKNLFEWSCRPHQSIINQCTSAECGETEYGNMYYYSGRAPAGDKRKYESLTFYLREGDGNHADAENRRKYFYGNEESADLIKRFRCSAIVIEGSTKYSTTRDTAQPLPLRKDPTKYSYGQEFMVAIPINRKVNPTAPLQSWMIFGAFYPDTVITVMTPTITDGNTTWVEVWKDSTDIAIRAKVPLSLQLEPPDLWKTYHLNRDRRVLHIMATKPITFIYMNGAKYNSDAFLVWPILSWGYEYVVTCSAVIHYQDMCYFTITSGFEDTPIRIGYANGTVDHITLKFAEKYEVLKRTSSSAGGRSRTGPIAGGVILSGTVILAENVKKPILVVSGNMRSRYPPESNTNYNYPHGYDHLATTLIDVQSADTEFYWHSTWRTDEFSMTHPDIFSAYPDQIYLVNMKENTSVTVKNRQWSTNTISVESYFVESPREGTTLLLHAGTGPVSLQSDKPVQIYSYISTTYFRESDPSLSTIPGRASWVDYYLFARPLRSDGTPFTRLDALMAAIEYDIEHLRIISHNSRGLIDYDGNIENMYEWIQPFDSEIIRYRMFNLIGDAHNVYSVEQSSFGLMYFGGAIYESFYTTCDLKLGFFLEEPARGMAKMAISFTAHDGVNVTVRPDILQIVASPGGSIQWTVNTINGYYGQILEVGLHVSGTGLEMSCYSNGSVGGTNPFWTDPINNPGVVDAQERSTVCVGYKTLYLDFVFKFPRIYFFPAFNQSGGYSAFLRDVHTGYTEHTETFTLNVLDWGEAFISVVKFDTITYAKDAYDGDTTQKLFGSNMILNITTGGSIQLSLRTEVTFMSGYSKLLEVGIRNKGTGLEMSCYSNGSVGGTYQFWTDPINNIGVFDEYEPSESCANYSQYFQKDYFTFPRMNIINKNQGSDYTAFLRDAASGDGLENGNFRIDLVDLVCRVWWRWVSDQGSGDQTFRIIHGHTGDLMTVILPGKTQWALNSKCDYYHGQLLKIGIVHLDTGSEISCYSNGSIGEANTTLVDEQEHITSCKNYMQWATIFISPYLNFLYMQQGGYYEGFIQDVKTGKTFHSEKKHSVRAFGEWSGWYCSSTSSFDGESACGPTGVGDKSRRRSCSPWDDMMCFIYSKELKALIRQGAACYKFSLWCSSKPVVTRLFRLTYLTNTVGSANNVI